MRYVNCNLCGADDSAVVFPKGFAQLHRIVRCNRCGLMYANPQEEVDCDHFASYAEDAAYDQEANRTYFQKQHVQLPDNERALGVLNALFPHRGKLLEIGSFLGIFLDRIRSAGWEVTGLEPYRPVANYARRKYGLNIVDAILPAAGFPEAAFDAVVMLHVIEHLPDPSADLREIRRILRPGGVLVVETPRFDSLMFKILGRRERSIGNCNGHIFFFTTTTLRKLLEKHSLEVFRTDLVGRTLTVEGLLLNLGIMSHSDRVKRWLAWLGTTFHLDRVRLYVNVRDMQRVYRRAR